MVRVPGSDSVRNPDASRTPRPATARRGVWQRWVLANVVGEIIGFGLAAAAGGLVALAIQGTEGIAAVSLGVAGVVVIGLIEGTAVGWSQWLVLRTLLPRLRRRAWLLATVAGAILAWGAGMALGTAVGESASLPDTALTAGFGAVAIGIFAGVLLSTVQWLVLRRHIDHAFWWVPTHAAAWAVGMCIAFGGMAFIEPETPMPVVALIGAGIGLGMGRSMCAQWPPWHTWRHAPHKLGLCRA